MKNLEHWQHVEGTYLSLACKRYYLLFINTSYQKLPFGSGDLLLCSPYDKYGTTWASTLITHEHLLNDKTKKIRGERKNNCLFIVVFALRQMTSQNLDRKKKTQNPDKEINQGCKAVLIPRAPPKHGLGRPWWRSRCLPHYENGVCLGSVMLRPWPFLLEKTPYYTGQHTYQDQIRCLIIWRIAVFDVRRGFW